MDRHENKIHFQKAKTKKASCRKSCRLGDEVGTGEEDNKYTREK